MDGTDVGTCYKAPDNAWITGKCTGNTGGTGDVTCPDTGNTQNKGSAVDGTDVGACCEVPDTAPTVDGVCWINLPTGCNKNLRETEANDVGSNPTGFFIDSANTESGCKGRLGAYNGYCSRSDGEHRWAPATTAKAATTTADAATTTTKVPGGVQILQYPATQCPVGTEMINDKTACRTAAGTNNLIFVKSLTNDYNWISGCFQSAEHNNNVYWNTRTGANTGNKGGNRLCLESGESTTNVAAASTAAAATTTAKAATTSAATSESTTAAASTTVAAASTTTVAATTSASCSVSDFSSKDRMTTDGWVFSVDSSVDFRPGTWSVEPHYWGYAHPGALRLSLTLVGSGTATLSFGNGYHSGGTVVATHGEPETRVETTSEEYKTISFNFEDGDVLSVFEDPNENTAVIVIRSLTLCPSAPASTTTATAATTTAKATTSAATSESTAAAASTTAAAASTTVVAATTSAATSKCTKEGSCLLKPVDLGGQECDRVGVDKAGSSGGFNGQQESYCKDLCMANVDCNWMSWKQGYCYMFASCNGRRSSGYSVHQKVQKTPTPAPTSSAAGFCAASGVQLGDVRAALSTSLRMNSRFCVLVRRWDLLGCSGLQIHKVKNALFCLNQTIVRSGHQADLHRHAGHVRGVHETRRRERRLYHQHVQPVRQEPQRPALCNGEWFDCVCLIAATPGTAQ